MKITVNLSASQNQSYYDFDLEDLGITSEAWAEMSESEKAGVLENACYDINEQPYWCLDSFTEKD